MNQNPYPMKTYLFYLQRLCANRNFLSGEGMSLRVQRKCLNATWLSILATVALSMSAVADLLPIPLTPESFTHDVVIERTAPPPLLCVTTASMDTGTNNSGYSWYERGYNLDFITTGLPAAGSIYTSELDWEHFFQFAPDYRSNNAVLIDGTRTSGALVLRNPAPYGRLSFLCAAGNANGFIGYIVRHQDGSSDYGTLPCPDWFHAMNPAVTAWGRVDVNLFTFDNVAYPQPGLFARDVALTNTTSAVTRIDFQYLSGASHNTVFAVSGALVPEDPFAPIQVSGFNEDLVVEATATRRQPLIGVSTATMDLGSGNGGCTFYDRGYYPPASGTGLPSAGLVITSAAAADHRFIMPPSYLQNNAALLEEGFEMANLVPANPVACSTLSLLCVSGHGPTTNGCIIFHSDGSIETNSFVAPDWLAGGSPALVANGRVNTNNRYVDNLNAGKPCLFAADIPLTNATSPVTNITVNFGPSPTGAHTFIFALSGSSGAPAPQRPVLTITPAGGRTLRISTTVPGQLQSSTALLGAATLWHDEGLIVSNLLVTPSLAAPLKFYRVQAQ
jgi:hypothetical protein